MNYGHESRAADRSTRTRPTSTPWQRETMSGKLLPMLPERDSLLSRIFGRRYGGGGR